MEIKDKRRFNPDGSPKDESPEEIGDEKEEENTEETGEGPKRGFNPSNLTRW